MTYSLVGYDDWLYKDVIGDMLWEEQFEFEWTESMVRLDHPHLSDEDVTILAEERMRTGYYKDYDF